ncbi:sensor histidine kinase [Methylomicrobium sp. RS1]|uniref:sensor histidine kinase n=1 Tax=Candidatus Methylomicrobium oryzae TaxID=2802053 RepID=UPI00192310F3|nr:histidine kinase [Methylomicrobium sp. RS1]MBL1262485.1 sensor histidine kinase [Methylomicrobium sp. RS1]
MNLQSHLLFRIAAVALACLLAASIYVLQRSNQQTRQTLQSVAESLGRQLEFQLLRIDAGFGQPRAFPDFSLWKETAGVPGLCIRFEPAGNTAVKSLCSGAKVSPHGSPESFASLYRALFAPGLEIARPVVFKDRVQGTLAVSSSAEMDIAQAWSDVRNLLGLSALTILAVCLPVYLSINRALRPAGIIVAGLETLRKGNLAHRLPTFELREWAQTAAAINQLAAAQQQLLAERQKLAVQLIDLQEQERRDLARELHDEFGQCLTAINAVAASITHTAERECPELIEETARIARISGHMMTHVRGLLGRLRPAEFDELGLAASLSSLVGGWNKHGAGKIRYESNITGDCGALPEPQAIALFRIAQECLTNIAKHSAANHGEVMLRVAEERAVLTVRDDGITSTLPLPEGPGIGLLGIRERVAALQGRLTLSIAEPHGLQVEVVLPIRRAAKPSCAAVAANAATPFRLGGKAERE